MHARRLRGGSCARDGERLQGRGAARRWAHARGVGKSSPASCPRPAHGEARRFVARTAATAYVSAPPIGRRRLYAPRPPAWPIASGSIRARGELREFARRSHLERWPRSMARNDHLGGPSAHSTTAETPWPQRESREPEGGEKWSGCHKSLPAGGDGHRGAAEPRCRRDRCGRGRRLLQDRGHGGLRSWGDHALRAEAR